MSDVMLTLGSFSFQLSTTVYQEFKRKTEYRWPKQERFGQAPVRQFTGPGDDSITLTGVIFTAWKGGRFQVDALRSLAAQGTPLALMAGDGTVMGRWVVESIEEAQSNFFEKGVPLKQEWTLELCKFDDKAPAAASGDMDLLDTMVANASYASQATSAASQAASLAGSVTSSLTAAAASIQGIANQVQTAVGPAITAVRQGLTVAANLKNAATEAQGLVKRLGSIKSLADAEGALGSLMRVASNSGAVASSASTALGTTLNTMTAAGEADTALAIMKGAQVSMNKLVNGVTAIRKQTDSIINSFK